MLNFDAEQLRSFARAWLERNGHATDLLNDSLFYFGELGMQEYRSSELMTAILADHGFAVERGISGFPTGFLASYGSGHPVIALHAEYDGLPSGSQMPGVAQQEWMIEGGSLDGRTATEEVVMQALFPHSSASTEG